MKTINYFGKFILYLDEKRNILWFKVWDSKIKDFRYFDYEVSWISSFPVDDDFTDDNKIDKIIKSGEDYHIKNSIAYLIVLSKNLEKLRKDKLINGYITKCLKEQTDILCSKYINSGNKLSDKAIRLIEILKENIPL